MSCTRKLVRGWLAAFVILSGACEVSDSGDGGLTDGGVQGMDAGADAGRDASASDDDAGDLPQPEMDAGTWVGRDASSWPLEYDGGHDSGGGELPEDAGHDAWVAPGDEDAGDDDGGVEDESIEVAGRWHSSFGGTEVIDDDSFESFGSSSPIAHYDNLVNFMVTQNPPDALYGPNKFNKIVWTEPTVGGFYYCWVDFSLDTAEQARNSTATADDSDPENGGCGGFAWTKSSPVIAVEGAWTDDVTPITIDSDTWGPLAIDSYGAQSAITRTMDGGAGPVTYDKVVWTHLTETGFQFCFVSMGEASAAAAETNAGVADSGDLATGCLGGAWSELHVVP
jgi:hypothetical protein